MRFAAKRINFGLLYGMGAFSLAKDLGVSNAEARTFIDAYFGQFPGVRGCLDGILAESFDDVVRYSEAHNVNNRIAAYMLAIDRVAFTIKQRGIYA